MWINAAMAGKDEAVVQASFDSFYSMNVTYDLTRQWNARAGLFEVGLPLAFINRRP
jgi:hypothetical protein